MRIETTPLADVLLISPRLHRDARGTFLEAVNTRSLSEAGIPEHWVQDNISESVQGVLRGLHCQVQQPQGKLVRCVAGAVFDVAVDLRPESRTFGKWIGQTLDASRWEALWVPPGFAHGFYVLSPRAAVYYKVTEYYAPQFERCLRWDDATVRIAWPLIPNTQPIVSERDGVGESLDAAREWFA